VKWLICARVCFGLYRERGDRGTGGVGVQLFARGLFEEREGGSGAVGIRLAGSSEVDIEELASSTNVEGGSVRREGEDAGRAAEAALVLDHADSGVGEGVGGGSGGEDIPDDDALSSGLCRGKEPTLLLVG
jgi:hypothetical protein